MNVNEEKIKLDDGQIIATIIYMVILILIIIILVNDKLRRQHKKPIMSRENESHLNVAIRVILEIIFIYFIWVNIKEYSLDTDRKLKQLDILAVIAGVLVIIAGAISIYIAYERDKDVSNTVSNPEI